uniref:histidine kinase n=1 Tax=Chromera velia CCMP2878 TaxID=1169474 RepID=A0A0G4FVC2_9ALVE|eukprot:Cvel_466.t1-p1 / transcript=Cvel_466.t1 / gene=Cvel_466 / organism=Chromera_velia_CCMP2878 / gene_product=hypothetical protein / transcript_product=hypothetical protein / location=Cvel_scaffold15:9163-11550(-) / protein_length=689 / sequence_SO=supercontig / SO=protein_coding / is_pseudo=false
MLTEGVQNEGQGLGRGRKKRSSRESTCLEKRSEEVQFRRACFEKQRKYFAAAVVPAAGTLEFFSFLLWQIGVLNGRSFWLAAAGIGSLVLGVSPELLCGSKAGSIRARDTLSFLGFWLFIVFCHLGVLTWEPPTKSILCYGLGNMAYMNKLFFISLHFSDTQFWILSLSDAALHTLNAHMRESTLTGGESVNEFRCLVLGNAFFWTIIVAGLRNLVTLTLRDAVEEVALRKYAEGLQDRFLSYIMHEMRNPLSGAFLLAMEFQESLRELLTDARRGKNQPKELRAAICKSTSRLQQLTGFLTSQLDKMRGVCDDVLQLEKLEKGGFEYAFRPANLRDWFTHLATQAAPLFSSPTLALHVSLSSTAAAPSEEKMVQFSWMFEVDGPEGERLLEERPLGVADFVRLDQVVSNFLSNARKFTKKGKVTLRCVVRAVSIPPSEEKDSATAAPTPTPRQALHTSTQSQQKTAALELSRQRETADNTCSSTSPSPLTSKRRETTWVNMRVSVTDTGPGLSEEDKSKLFKPYGQVRAGELQNGGGTGLGLVICKSFVEAHTGGRIGVESEGRGEGSTFFFEVFIPLIQPNPHLSPSLYGEGSPETPLAEDPAGDSTPDSPLLLPSPCLRRSGICVCGQRRTEVDEASPQSRSSLSSPTRRASDPGTTPMAGLQFSITPSRKFLSKLVETTAEATRE